MSVIWQTPGETTINRGLNSLALEVKIIVSAFLFIGGIHLCLILIAFSQYGDIDENWTERFKRIIHPASMVQVHKPATVAAGAALPRSIAVPPQQQESHRHAIETNRPSQPSSTSSIPTVVIDPGTPTPSSSQPRNSNNHTSSIKLPEAASQFPRHAGPSVPATTPEETTVPSSQQQDLPGHNTGGHQPSQPPSAEPHPMENTAAPPSNSSSLPPQPPDNSYPGNRFVPQFATPSHQYNYPTAPAAVSSARGPARSDNVLPPFASTPYYVNYPTAPVGVLSEREPARSDVLPPFASTPYYVNYPMAPAEAGRSRSRSRSINSLLPPFTSPGSSPWPSSSAQYTSVPQYTNTPLFASPQRYASGVPPALPVGRSALGYEPSSMYASTLDVQTSHRSPGSSP